MHVLLDLPQGPTVIVLAATKLTEDLPGVAHPLTNTSIVIENTVDRHLTNAIENIVDTANPKKDVVAHLIETENLNTENIVSEAGRHIHEKDIRRHLTKCAEILVDPHRNTEVFQKIQEGLYHLIQFHHILVRHGLFMR